jgi:hypothetical protein
LQEARTAANLNAMPAKKSKQQKIEKLFKSSTPPRPAGVQKAFEEGVGDAAGHLTGGDSAEKFTIDKDIRIEGEKKTEQYTFRRTRKRKR